MKSGDNLTLTQSNATALEEHWRGNRESPPLPIIAWTRRATGPKHCFGSLIIKRKTIIEIGNSMKILMVLTSHDKLGNTGRKTGFGSRN